MGSEAVDHIHRDVRACFGLGEILAGQPDGGGGLSLGFTSGAPQFTEPLTHPLQILATISHVSTIDDSTNVAYSRHMRVE